jgi:hypothetical protein
MPPATSVTGTTLTAKPAKPRARQNYQGRRTPEPGGEQLRETGRPGRAARRGPAESDDRAAWARPRNAVPGLPHRAGWQTPLVNQYVNPDQAPLLTITVALG